MNVMSGLVVLRYINLPMSLLYAGVSSNARLWSWHNFIVGSEDVLTVWEPRKAESVNMSRQYFLWHMVIPCFECATSNPKKYLSVPRSLILKA